MQNNGFKIGPPLYIYDDPECTLVNFLTRYKGLLDCVDY